MSAESLLPWLPPDTEHKMVTADIRDVVLVAGHDPHAHKGLEDIHRPFVRPDDGAVSPHSAPKLVTNGRHRA